jgi:tRNA dimethylallyltransferase
MPVLHFLIGPTASGKTSLALRWAAAVGAEILYCDAFCVYRGMDVGTAKPTAAERARVPHHGLDLVPVDRAFSIADYVAEARRVVADCRGRGVPLLVTGGTGFYARSFFHPVMDETQVPEAVRAQVRDLAARGPDVPLAELLRLNPEGVAGVDLRNPRRVAAALERCMASGLPLAELRRRYEAQPPPFPDWEKRLVLLDRPRAELDARIARRTLQMLDDGLADEVRRLRAEGLERNPTASAAIGYRETIEWLDARGNVDALVDAITRNTCRLVRKQQSYYRTQLPPARVLELHGDDPGDPGELF